MFVMVKVTEARKQQQANTSKHDGYTAQLQRSDTSWPNDNQQAKERIYLA